MKRDKARFIIGKYSDFLFVRAYILEYFGQSYAGAVLQIIDLLHGRLGSLHFSLESLETGAVFRRAHARALHGLRRNAHARAELAL